MVIERVEIKVKDGKEEELLAFLDHSRGLVQAAKGYRSMTYGRGVEDPNKVFLLVGWDSVEAHKEATQQPEYQPFRMGMGAFVAGAAVEHFTLAYAV